MNRIDALQYYNNNRLDTALVKSKAFPNNVLFKIFSFLDNKKDLVQAGSVCRKWRQVASDPRLWGQFTLETIRNNLMHNVQRNFSLTHTAPIDSIQKISGHTIYVYYKNGDLVEWNIAHVVPEKKIFAIGNAAWIKISSDLVIAYDKSSNTLNFYDRSTQELVDDLDGSILQLTNMEKVQIQTHKKSVFIDVSDIIFELNTDKKNFVDALNVKKSRPATFFKVKYPIMVVGLGNRHAIYNLAEKIWQQAASTKPLKLSYHNGQHQLLTYGNDRKIHAVHVTSSKTVSIRPRRAAYGVDIGTERIPHLDQKTNSVMRVWWTHETKLEWYQDDHVYEKKLVDISHSYLEKTDLTKATFEDLQLKPPQGLKHEHLLNDLFDEFHLGGSHIDAAKKIEKHGDYYIFNGLRGDCSAFEKNYAVTANSVWKQHKSELVHHYNIPQLSAKAILKNGILCEIGDSMTVKVTDFSAPPIGQNIPIKLRFFSKQALLQGIAKAKSSIVNFFGFKPDEKIDPATVLPDEMMVKIFEFLSIYDLGKLNRVNRTYRRLANTKELWRNLYLNQYRRSSIRFSQNENDLAGLFKELCISSDRNERLGGLKCKTESFFVREHDCKETVLEKQIDGCRYDSRFFSHCNSNTLIQIFEGTGSATKGYVYGLRSGKMLHKIEIPEIQSRPLYHPIVDFKKRLLIALVQEPSQVMVYDLNKKQLVKLSSIQMQGTASFERTASHPLQYDSQRGVFSYGPYIIELNGTIATQIPEGTVAGFDVENRLIFTRCNKTHTFTIYRFNNEWSALPLKQDATARGLFAYDRKEQIAIVPSNDTLKIVDLKTGELDFMKVPGFKIQAMTYDPFSRLCLVASGSTLKICDMEDRSCLATYQLRGDLIREIQYDAASRLAMIYSSRRFADATANDFSPNYGALSLWNMATGCHLRDFDPGEGFEVTGMEWDAKLHTVMIQAQNMVSKSTKKTIKYAYS